MAHIFWTVMGATLIAGCLWRFGKKPRQARIAFYGLLGALGFFCAFAAFSVVGTPEGTRSNSHFFGIFIGSWLLLTFIETKKRAIFLSFCFLFYVTALRIEYMNLAQSRSFTDNPKARLETIASINELRIKKKLSPIENTKIHPVWHTGLTNLQEVKPPFGDYKDFEDASSLN